MTSRIRLGLLVTGATYRHPSVFTAQAVTIDHASGGRLDLSLGAAWFDAEHTALGIPFPSTSERFDLLEDSLEIVTRLMTGERVSYDGKVVSLKDAQVRPTPVQSPHPPIWIGGGGPKRTLPLVARYADAWHTWGTPNSAARGECHASTSSPTRPGAIRRRSSGRVAVARARPRPGAQAHRQVARRWWSYLIAVGPTRVRAGRAVATEVLPEFA